MSFVNQLAQLSAQNTALSQQFAREQMAFQAQQNQIARDWQERMSNTAHQRQVKDLQAAGLNPILSVNSGAATGSASGAAGASGSVDTSAVSALASIAAASMNIAANERIADKQLENALKVALLQTGSAEKVANIGNQNSLYGTIWNIAEGLTDSLSDLFGIKNGSDKNAKKGVYGVSRSKSGSSW